MFRGARWMFGVSLVFGLAACKGGVEKGKIDAKAFEAKSTEKAEEAKKVEAPKPAVVRGVSRPDERFSLTLEGPAFETPQTFTFSPDAVRINVITTRSAIQFVRQNNEPATSPDGSQIVVAQVKWTGGQPGEFAYDDNRTFVITLGVETAKQEAITLHLDGGKLTTTKSGFDPRELVGTLEGTLRRINKGKETERYELTGDFNLAQ